MGTSVKPKATIRCLKVAKENREDDSSLSGIQSKYLIKKDDRKTELPPKEVSSAKEKRQSLIGLPQKLKNTNAGLTKDAKPMTPRERIKITTSIKEKSVTMAKNPSQSPIAIPQSQVPIAKSSQKVARKIPLIGLNKIVPSLAVQNVNLEKNMTSQNQIVVLEKVKSSDISPETSSEVSEVKSAPNIHEEFQNVFKNLQTKASDEEREVLEAKKKHLEMIYYGIACLVPNEVDEKALREAGATYVKSKTESKIVYKKKSKSNANFESGDKKSENENVKVKDEKSIKVLAIPQIPAYKSVNSVKSFDKKVNNNQENTLHKNDAGGGGGQKSLNKNQKVEIENTKTTTLLSNKNNNNVRNEKKNVSIMENVLSKGSNCDKKQKYSEAMKRFQLLLKQGNIQYAKAQEIPLEENKIEREEHEGHEEHVGSDEEEVRKTISEGSFELSNEEECCLTDDGQLNVGMISSRISKPLLSPVYEEDSSDMQSSPRSTNTTRSDNEKICCFRRIVDPDAELKDSTTSLDCVSTNAHRTVSSETFSKSNKDDVLSGEELDDKFKRKSLTDFEIMEIEMEAKMKRENEQAASESANSRSQEEHAADVEKTTAHETSEQSNLERSLSPAEPNEGELKKNEKSASNFDRNESFVQMNPAGFAELQNKPIYQSQNSSFVWSNQNENKNEKLEVDFLLMQSLAESSHNALHTTNKILNEVQQKANSQESGNFFEDDPFFKSNYKTISMIIEDLKVKSCHSLAPAITDTENSISECYDLPESSHSQLIEKKSSGNVASKQEDALLDESSKCTTDNNSANEISSTQSTEQTENSAENWMKAFILRMSKTYDLPSNEPRTSSQADISNSASSFVENSIPSRAKPEVELSNRKSDTQLLIKQIESNLEQIRAGLTELCRACDEEIKKDFRRRSKAVSIPLRRKLSFSKIGDNQTFPNSKHEMENMDSVETGRPNEASSKEKYMGKSYAEREASSEITSDERHFSCDPTDSEKEPIPTVRIQDDDQTCEPSFTHSDIVRYIQSLNVLENIADNIRGNTIDSEKEMSTKQKIDKLVGNGPKYTGCPCMMATYRIILDELQKTTTKTN